MAVSSFPFLGNSTGHKKDFMGHKKGFIPLDSLHTNDYKEVINSVQKIKTTGQSDFIPVKVTTCGLQIGQQL